MELRASTTAVFCCVVVAAVAVYAWRFYNWVWVNPKKAEKWLIMQGLHGTPYKFSFGDVKGMMERTTWTKSKPINLTDNIIPRVMQDIFLMSFFYGKNFFTWKGPRLLVHITEPALIQEVLAKFFQFQKQRGNPLTKLLAPGLAGVEPDQWAKHRKIINPAFHMEKLKHMLPAIYISCSEMINKWEELTNETPSEVDVLPHLQTFSSDVISRTTFGSSYDEGRKIFELQREQAKLIIKAEQSIYIPGSSVLPTKNNRRIKEIDREVKGLIRKIIDKRVMAMKERKSSNDDLLGILLDSNYKEIKQHGNSNFGLSTDEVIEECKLFYFAGQETTASLLVWTMLLLGQHTNWQDRAREEVLKVFGERKPDVDGLSQLKIVDMIFHEVLRLYPPIIGLGRMVHEQTFLRNVILPAGSLIQLHMMLLHHDSAIWGDDVKEFKPERFAEGVSKATKGQPVYFPFGGGPRICIGQNFTMLEAKMALTMILQRFSFELSPLYSHAPHAIVTLQPQFGAQLIICNVRDYMAKSSTHISTVA